MKKWLFFLLLSAAAGGGLYFWWGLTGVQKETVLAATRSLITVEEIVDKFQPRAGQVILPHWAVDYVAVSPGGAGEASSGTFALLYRYL